MAYIKKDNIFKLEEFKQYLEDNYDGEVSLEEQNEIMKSNWYIQWMKEYQK